MKALVAHMAHGFNNSLAPLAGYITLLSDEIGRNSQAEQYLVRCESSTRRAESFLAVLLEATHPERRFLPKTVDFTSLIQGSTDAWMKSLPASTQVSVEINLVPCTLDLDENQWSQVARHLLRNAQLALPEGGMVKLSLQRQLLTADAALELGLSTNEVYQLTIEDTGCGMGEDVLERACEPFYTTRPAGHCTGLGLTLVHSVVQLQGGQLEIQSTEGSGTKVTIWLPAN
jgi:signal transduction histidine kinase